MNKEQELNLQLGTPIIEKQEIKKVEKVSDTPFSVVTTEDGSFIGFGKYRVTPLITRTECYEMIDNRSWDLLLGVCSALVGMEIDDLKQLNNLQ